MSLLSETLYAKYIFEREGAEVLCSESGFITYKIIGEQCHMMDVFVEKDARRQGEFKKLVAQLISIAVNAECKHMLAQVFLWDPNYKTTLQAALSMGGEIVNTDGERLVLKMKLAGG